MKNPCFGFTSLVVAFAVFSSNAALAETLASPDGRIRLSAELNAGCPQWQIAFAGKPLLERGALGLELARDDFRAPVIIEHVQRAERSQTAGI